MSSFIKKILTEEECSLFAKDIVDLYIKDGNKYTHFDIDYDFETLRKSCNHSSLLNWNLHTWGHFNGEKWDGCFVGSSRISEKTSKKIFEEYLWFSKNPKIGFKLFQTALDFAKNTNCNVFVSNLMSASEKAEKLRRFYSKLGMKKDVESYFLKLT